MPRAAIPAEAFDHGDPRRYSRGCHCPACTRAATKAARKNKYLRETGRGTLTTLDRALHHIALLRAAGSSDLDIMAAAAISRDTMYRLLRQEGRVTRAVEQRILSVPIRQAGAVQSRALVSALGTRRRLRTLTAQGWPANYLARRMNSSKRNLSRLLQGNGGWVRMWMADAVTCLYTELKDLKPEENGVAAHHAEQARQRAAENGWPGADYWDSDSFDNPDFVPATSDALKQQAAARLAAEEIRHLASCNLSVPEIAGRVGRAEKYVRAQLGPRGTGWRQRQREEQQDRPTPARSRTEPKPRATKMSAPARSGGGQVTPNSTEPTQPPEPERGHCLAQR
jgi:hypothetical protein